jgi:hypothetical protein
MDNVNWAGDEHSGHMRTGEKRNHQDYFMLKIFHCFCFPTYGSAEATKSEISLLYKDIKTASCY